MVTAFVLHQYDLFLLFYNTTQYNTQNEYLCENTTYTLLEVFRD